MILLYAKCHTSPMAWAHPCVLRSRCISRSALSVYRRLHGPILYTFSFSLPGTVPDWITYTICCFNFEMTVPESSLLWDCKLSCGWCPQPLRSGVPLSWCVRTQNRSGTGGQRRVQTWEEVTWKWHLMPELTEFFSFPYIGSLQIQYNLGGTRQPYNIDVDHRNMANGQPHSVNITRHERTIILKVSMCVRVSCTS